MSQVYGRATIASPPQRSNAQSISASTFSTTADVYGTGHNEELVGKAAREASRSRIIATKFANQVLPDGKRAINGRPEYLRSACDASLKRLGVEPYRSVLSASRRQERSDRGDGWRDGGTGARG